MPGFSRGFSDVSPLTECGASLLGTWRDDRPFHPRRDCASGGRRSGPKKRVGAASFPGRQRAACRHVLVLVLAYLYDIAVGERGAPIGSAWLRKALSSACSDELRGEYAPGHAPDLSLGAGTRRRCDRGSRLALGRRACLAGGWGGDGRWRQMEERTERSAGPVGLARRALIGQRWRPRPLISYLPPGVAPACRARRRVHADQRPTNCPPCWPCWARGARSDWLVRRSRPAADKRCVGAASAQRPSGVPRADAYLCCASMRAMRARGQAMRDQPCFYRAAQSNGRPDHTPHPRFNEAVPCAHSRTPH